MQRMRWTGLLVVICAFAWFACGGDPNKPDEQPPELLPKVETIGGERPAQVFYPKTFDPSKKYPVALLIHGYSVNGFLQNLIVQLEERVSAFDFVLIVPEGTVNSAGAQFWNAFPQCCNFDGSDVDDVGYLASLVDEIGQYVWVDKERVSFVGHSNGGYMSYRMACDRPDLVRRIVILAGSMPLDESLCPAPEKPVRVLHIHGTNDIVVPWENNVNGIPGDGHGIITKGADDSVSRWVDFDHCDRDAVIEEREDFFRRKEGAETAIHRWDQCADGAVLEQWNVEGADHFLAGGSETFKDRLATFLVEP